MANTVRDRVLPVIDRARGKIASLGLRRFAVTLRRRTWSGDYVGGGTPTDEDIVITPIPRVRSKNAASASSAADLEYILVNGNLLKDRYYEIDRITPAYSSKTTGGYTPNQMRMQVSADIKNVEATVVLVGDDGLLRECTQLEFDEDHAFGYRMLVVETDRPRVSLTSIAITPNPSSLTRPATLQFKAMGTFDDNTVYDVTPIVVWSSDTPAKATIDVLGVASGVAAGTANISASLGGVSSPASTLTVT